MSTDSRYHLFDAPVDKIDAILKSTDASWMTDHREELKRRWASSAANSIRLLNQNPEEYRDGPERHREVSLITFGENITLDYAMSIFYPEDEDFIWATRPLDI